MQHVALWRGVFGGARRRLQHAMRADAGAVLAELIRRAQQPVSNETIRRLEQAAATGADRRAAALARAHWRRDALLAAGALFGTALLFGAGGVAGGYAWGHTIRTTNDARRAASSDPLMGPQGEHLRMLEGLARAALACDTRGLFVSSEDFDLISTHF